MASETDSKKEVSIGTDRKPHTFLEGYWGPQVVSKTEWLGWIVSRVVIGPDGDIKFLTVLGTVV